MKLRLILLFNLVITTEMFCGGLFRSGVGDRQKYDSLWYWHPLSIDLMAGAWIPLGKLADYQKTGGQYGVGLGLMLTKRTRLQYWIVGRSLYSKAPVEIMDNYTSKNGKISSGGSIGGLLSFRVIQNRHLSSEILAGASKEILGTNIENSRPKNRFDSLISFSTLGLSIGFNSWLNTYKKLNFGLRAIYTYSNYDNTKKLYHSIGAHSINLALVYRIPGRCVENKKYY